MLLALSSDQEFFKETTGRFLLDQAPTSEVRRLRDVPAGFEADYWRRGAELGWTSLLVSEDHGGGTISGAGLVDLSLLAYEFGQHAAPGPLLPTNIVAGTLSAHGSHTDVLAGVLEGTEVVAWCAPGLAPAYGSWATTAEIARDGTDLVVRGQSAPVEFAGQAGHLLVTGRDDHGLTQVLVPASAAGVSIEPLRTTDLTRRFGAVTFDDVRLSTEALVGPPQDAAADVERQFHRALVILNAEAVGAMQAAFDMTVEWAFDRYAFGRPLASYQALKHRFADMITWVEASHAISDAACLATQEGSPEAAELTSAAKAFIGQYGAEVLQDCVQMHGGIGVTFEHDLHLFLRRCTVNRALAGTPAEHRQRIGAIVNQREGAAA